ncbi:hypothetical protein [Burkholderia contaminans]|nr:hypothetical protein [Burkholderia contaminans]
MKIGLTNRVAILRTMRGLRALPGMIPQESTFQFTSTNSGARSW